MHEIDRECDDLNWFCDDDDVVPMKPRAQNMSRGGKPQAPRRDTIYADQKVGALPEGVSRENYGGGGRVNDERATRDYYTPKERAAIARQHNSARIAEIDAEARATPGAYWRDLALQTGRGVASLAELPGLIGDALNWASPNAGQQVPRWATSEGIGDVLDMVFPAPTTKHGAAAGRDLGEALTGMVGLGIPMNAGRVARGVGHAGNALNLGASLLSGPEREPTHEQLNAYERFAHAPKMSRGGTPQAPRRDTENDYAGSPTRLIKKLRNVEFTDEFDKIFGGQARQASDEVRAHTERTGTEGLIYGDEFNRSPITRGEQYRVAIPDALQGYAKRMDEKDIPFFTSHSHPVISNDALAPRSLNMSTLNETIESMRKGLPGMINPSPGDLRMLQMFSPKQQTMIIDGGGRPNTRVMLRPGDAGMNEPRDMEPVLQALSSRKPSNRNYDFAQRDFNTSVGNHPADLSGYSMLMNKLLAEQGGLPVYVDSRATSSGGHALRDLMPEFEGYLIKKDAMPYARGGST